MNRIKELRQLRKMTQLELAEKIGVSQVQIGRLEKGERGLDIDDLPLFADALECEAWELLPKDMQPRAIFYCGALSDLNQLLEEEDRHKTTKTSERYITVTTCRNDRIKPRLH